MRMPAEVDLKSLRMVDILLRESDRPSGLYGTISPSHSSNESTWFNICDALDMDDEELDEFIRQYGLRDEYLIKYSYNHGAVRDVDDYDDNEVEITSDGGLKQDIAKVERDNPNLANQIMSSFEEWCNDLSNFA